MNYIKKRLSPCFVRFLSENGGRLHPEGFVPSGYSRFARVSLPIREDEAKNDCGSEDSKVCFDAFLAAVKKFFLTCKPVGNDFWFVFSQLYKSTKEAVSKMVKSSKIIIFFLYYTC